MGQRLEPLSRESMSAQGVLSCTVATFLQSLRGTRFTLQAVPTGDSGEVPRMLWSRDLTHHCLALERDSGKSRNGLSAGALGRFCQRRGSPNFGCL